MGREHKMPDLRVIKTEAIEGAWQADEAARKARFYKLDAICRGTEAQVESWREMSERYERLADELWSIADSIKVG